MGEATTTPRTAGDATSDPVRPAAAPASFLTLSEPVRSVWDFGRLAFSLPLLWNEAPGDGHPVIVLPGFLLDDQSTWWLRTYLTSLGYRVYGFCLGQNLGARTVGHCGARLTEMIERLVGREPVSLIGHSLGGVLARDYARQHPERVRRVITLGSPYAGDERSMPGPIVQLRRYLAREALRKAPDHSPLPVPHTIIYSQGDGVVAAFDCRHPHANADNIEVPGSHIGLVVNPAVFQVVADRLRAPPERAPSTGRGPGAEHGAAPQQLQKNTSLERTPGEASHAQDQMTGD